MNGLDAPLPKFTGYRLLVGAAAMVVVGAGLVEMRSILAPFFFALLVALAGALPLQWLQNRRVPGPVAAMIVAGFFGLLLFLLGLVASASLQSLTESLPSYRTRIETLAVQTEANLSRRGIIVPTDAMEIDESVAVGVVANVLQSLARSFSSIATAIVILIFILLEAADYRVKFRAALSHAMDVDRLERVAEDVQRYLFVKTLTSGLTGLLIGILCLIMGVEFAVLWGLTAFVLNYIPVVGSIIASFPALLLAMLTGSWVHVLALAIGYIVVNTAVSNFLEPTLMGRHLGLSPLVVFMGLVFWGWAWGPIGMFLSVPITMLGKILLENSEDLRWLATLMSSARSLKLDPSEPAESALAPSETG